jgi:subtilase family serine protease
MRITVVLRPRDPSALKAFATAVATPGSSLYGRYITPAQFARRFGPAPAQIAAVQRSLRAHGLRPGKPSPNSLSIPVTASAGGIERAFSLVLVRLRLRDGSGAVLNSLAPSLDGGVAGTVQAVLGLTSTSGLHPRRVPARLLRGGRLRTPATAHVSTGGPRTRATAHVSAGGPQPCPAATAAASLQSAYTADRIASAYGLPGLYGAGNQGQGQTIALYELEPNAPGDIAAYAACYGIKPSVAYRPVDGGVGSGAGSGEAALDIEQAMGLAPKASFIVYQGPNSDLSSPGSGPYDTFAAAVSDDKAHVVSVSWGQCEPLEGAPSAQAENILFEEAAAQGQSILAASGDAGSEDCGGGQTLGDIRPAVDDPGSQPFVTSVGGTTLSAIGPPPSETVWNNGGGLGGLLGIQPGAGGGGVSQLWGMPAFQSSAPAFLRVIQAGSSGSPCGASSGYCREVPDISANADPNTGYLIYYNGSASVGNTPVGWQGTGGTSGSAPLWAAAIGLANASKACGGVPIGFLNPGLYRAAATGYGAYFHDVVAGNNDFTGTNGGRYAAGAGYDMGSGLGTPNASALAGALCADSLRLVTPSAQRAALGSSVSLQIRASDARGLALSYGAAGLPSGLRLDPASGKVSGRPRQTGTANVRLSVSDSAGGVRTASFAWTIGAAPKLSAVSITGIRAARPVLQFTVAAGRGAPALTQIVVGLPHGLSFAATVRRVTITGSGGRRVGFRSAVARGTLTIRLRSGAPSLHLSVSYASIGASAALVTGIQSGRVGKLELRVKVTDAGGGVTRLTASTKPRS